jgi:hypothetical protein
MKLHAHRRRKAAARAIFTAMATLAMAGGIQDAVGAAPAFAARTGPVAVASQAGHTAATPKWMHLINLRSGYEHALAHVKVGKIAGITYRIGYHPKAAAAGKALASCTEPNCPLVYNSGPVEHTVHIYLLLWGPTWATDSGETASAAYMQNFYEGLGVEPQDTWSPTTSQYSDSTGSPAFSGSQFSGAFADTSTPPADTTPTQFTTEADAFASSQNLTTNPQDDQIVIATQSGTCPQDFGAPSCFGGTGTYCAYHSYDPTSGVTFTNMPYLLDAGVDCGENFINAGSAGTYDGFSIVGGHEYAETITDPYPDSGWIDLNDSISGGEIGDKCAWAGEIWGTHDPAGDVTLSTGTFAMQSLWSNAANGCAMAPADQLSVTNPGNQSTAEGSAVSLQIHAASSTSAQLTYAASSLPAGLSINSSTGLITGTPTTGGASNVTVAVDDTTGASRSVSFTWTITGTVSVTSPGNQTTSAGTGVSLHITATDSAQLALSYKATGLPAGLSINSATGLITGTPTSAGSSNVTVAATDTLNDTGSASFTWTVSPGCRPAQVLKNPGFEAGRLAAWHATQGVLTRSSRSYPAHSGKWLALLKESIPRRTNYLSQKVTIGAGCGSAKLSFWLKVGTKAPRRRVFATLKVEILTPRGTVLKALRTYTNRDSGRYRDYTFNLGNYAGKTIVVKFVGRDNLRGRTTSFLIDDTALRIS